MDSTQLDSERRCHGVLGDGGRCLRHTVADGWCTLHHPLRNSDEIKKRRAQVMAKRAVLLGEHDFWCQVAIAALMAYLEKAAPEHYRALRSRLR